LVVFIGLAASIKTPLIGRHSDPESKVGMERVVERDI
jgi:hypothetical protein